MKTIKIENGRKEVKLSFAVTSEFEQCVKAIEDCINYEYHKLINYIGPDCEMILTRDFLRHSLITIIKD